MANLEKFNEINFPDYVDHFQNFTSSNSSNQWKSNLTLAIKKGYVNGVYAHAHDASKPFVGDALESGELLFSEGELRELLVTAIAGGFRITIDGGGELNDGFATISEGDMLYIPSPRLP
eukprot:CAMPEP_0118641754 /NCGR_PEP_ID=MMETSP0785-20121206/5468_1 /TAXON_ID=91992 /ORGANISM="Bolidomonas pacifica, Strain CCMP 1866" /LENGTH=118 /DNA_ID=CAMNT_0006533255 /DNA_START=526 /DNA_END=879 /DNA_ORIENTATION=-